MFKVIVSLNGLLEESFDDHGKALEHYVQQCRYHGEALAMDVHSSVCTISLQQTKTNFIEKTMKITSQVN